MLVGIAAILPSAGRYAMSAGIGVRGFAQPP
jgi:hypothetical protein